MAEGKPKDLPTAKLIKVLKFRTFHSLLKLIHVKLKTSLQTLN